MKDAGLRFILVDPVFGSWAADEEEDLLTSHSFGTRFEIYTALYPSSHCSRSPPYRKAFTVSLLD